MLYKYRGALSNVILKKGVIFSPGIQASLHPFPQFATAEGAGLEFSGCAAPVCSSP